MPLLLGAESPLPLFFAPGEYSVEPAVSPWQRESCFALRRQVFCVEQKIFAYDDRDENDRKSIMLGAWSCLFGHCDDVVGTVRLHQPESGLWWGSRLAVAKPYRRIGGLGAALIKLAVGTAKAQGAKNFLAHVQAQNRTLFEALDWSVIDEKTIHGRSHYLMQADLAAYQPMVTGLRVLPQTVFAG